MDRFLGMYIGSDTSYLSRNMSHFQDRKHSISMDLSLDSSGGPGLRHCQVGAICALTAHFSVTASAPGIISLPTGTGKTAVLLISPYILKAKRVLLTTSSEILREQITCDAEDLSTLKRIGIATEDWSLPEVLEVTETVNDTSQWSAMENYDLVVALPNCISPAMKTVDKNPPRDLFDLILIDEAHHQPSKTWNELLSSFDARCILATATPFRGDRLSLDGKIIYSYSLREALANEDLKDIKISRVDGAYSEIDQKLASAAQHVFEEDRANGLSHRLVARVESLDRADEVVQVYRDKTSLKVERLDSSLRKQEIDEVIEDLKDGSLDGVVCVDMLNEGFDLANLKIAVVHDQHQSLLPTVQFIGRFLRIGDSKIGDATLITTPVGFAERGYQLYHSENILSHASELIDRQQAEVQLTGDIGAELERQSGLSARLEQLVWDSLNPYFQVKIFRAISVDFSAELSLQRGYRVVYRRFDPTLNIVAMIAKRETKPNWFTVDGLSSTEYELLLLCFVSSEQLLFVCWSGSTSSVYEKLLEQVCPNSASPVSLKDLRNVLIDFDDTHFYSIGLSNGLFGASDAYRTMAGPAVEEAVLASDARLFHYSHLFGKGNDGGRKATIGFSKNSKAWSSRRATIPDFVDWCRSISSKISSNRTLQLQPHLKNLLSLPIPTEVDVIPKNLLGATYWSGVYQDPPLIREIGNIPLTECKLSCRRKSDSQIEMQVEYEADSDRILFDIASNEQFSSANSKFSLIQGRSPLSLANYFCAHPPSFFFWDFSQLNGKLLWKPDVTHFSPVEIHPGKNFITHDWKSDQVDIEVEVDFNPDNPIPPPGTTTIHDFLRSHLQGVHDIVFYNQGSAEYADFLCFDEEGTVSFYHCKGSCGPRPGLRQDDLKEVFLQALNSIHWVRKREQILEHLESRDGGPACRLDGTIVRRFEKPTVDGLTSAKNVLMDTSISLKYRVVIVQPGISLRKLERLTQAASVDLNSRRLLEGFAGLQDTVRRAGADLAFMCTESEVGY